MLMSGYFLHTHHYDTIFSPETEEYIGIASNYDKQKI